MARMGQLTICAGPWSLVVPFTLDGLEVATKFLDLLDKMLTKELSDDE